MRPLHRFAIRHPVLTVTIAVLVTLAIAPGILRLRLRTDGHALVPSRAPAVVLDRAVRGEFGVRDPLLVLVRPRHRDSILNPRTLHLVADLTAALARLPGLDEANVRSLSTETSDHFRPGTLEYRRLLEPVPESPAQLEELRGDLEAIGLYTGTLVSFDGRATAIHVGVPPDANRAALLGAIGEVIGRADTAGHDVHLIGAPVAEALLGTHILEDLGISWSAASRRSARTADRPDRGLGPISRLRLAIARHFGLLALSIAIMALVFLISFRSLTATLLPLSEASACLAVVFGLMGWTGVPVYLTMAVLPVILVSMGLADEIHVFTCYSQHRAARPAAPVAEVVGAALDDMSLPVVATSVTTAVGFLSFAISPLAPVRAFGLFTAIGILFCMLWTLTVIPALLVLLAPRGLRASGLATRSQAGFGAGWWRMFGARAGRRPAPTLAIAALALVLTPLGIRRLAVQDSWISGFAPESDFYRATRDFNLRFFGTHQLLLVLDTGRVDLRGPLSAADLGHGELRLPADLVPDPEVLEGCSIVVTTRRSSERRGAPRLVPDRPASWASTVEGAERREGRIVLTTPLVHGSALFLLAPAPGDTLEYSIRSRRLALPGVLRTVEALEDFVRTQTRYTVGGVLGPAAQIATAAFLVNGRAPGSRAIPNDPEYVGWLWNALEQVRGPERIREIVDAKFQRGIVTVFLKDANYVDTARLMETLRGYERAHLAPERIRLEFAGDVAVSQALVEGIVRSQVGSLLLSLVGILVVIAVLFRSLRWGLLCMVPAGLSVAATFAVMGLVAMPLGVATSMFAGMVLGIGVDFAIHLAERYRMSVGRGAASEAALLESLVATGPAIVVNALAVALGFGILMLSRVPANAQLGAITVVSLTTCLAATLLVLPALIRVAGARAASK